MDETPPKLRVIEKPFGFEQREKKADWSEDVTAQDVLYDVQEILRGKKVLSCMVIYRIEDEGGSKTAFRAAGSNAHLESGFLRVLGRFMSWEK